jgi:alkanesulfonate monooxygenase SsuD/methylene tetrahydromethanopterin reductase-like flavin-dependent oxidoreductase (luciferase family)
MRFGYHAGMCNPAFYGPLAKEAEAIGFDSFTLADSICYPQDGDATYPYNADGSREFLDGVPFIEPMTLIPYMAALAPKLMFSTSVLKLPIRNPVILAKQVTSVQVITGNRLVLGVGLSPWKEDFAVTGTDYASRAARMEDMIAILRGLSTGEYFGFESEHYSIAPIKLCPVPTVPVPILYGSHSAPGLRRAAKLCDGWISAGADMDGLREMISTLDAHRREFGRGHLPFDMQVMGAAVYDAENVKRLEELGVTECLVAFRDTYAGGPDDRTVESMIGEMRWYADAVMAKVGR